MSTVESQHADTDDINGLDHTHEMDNPLDGILREGTVERVIPGTYTLICSFPGEGEQPCVYAPSAIAPQLGVSDCELPTEGTYVLAFCPPHGIFRYVIACIPEITVGLATGDDIEDPGRETSQDINHEPGADYTSQSSYSDIAGDPTTDNHLNTNTGRPWNVLAGEWVKGNKFGVTLAVMHFYTIMQAGDGASLEMSVFDDLVRLTSGTYEHNSATGRYRVFDDEGNLCTEITGSCFSHERINEDDFKEVLTEGDPENHTENAIPIDVAEERNYIPKDRYSIFSGAMADLFQLYSRNPYGQSTASTSADFRASLGYDGKFDLSSRAGLSFSLKSKIPMPTRQREPWDPEGDTDVEPAAKTPFKFDAGYPYGRNLQMREALAWNERNIYKRFDERPQDFVTPEHGGTNDPSTTTDKYGSETEENRQKNAGWDIMPDGSLRFWDAWGSEIYMRGGNIYITCPGSVERHVGKSDVTLAGQDIVQKARESVDIHAANKDLRMTAKGQAHMHSVSKGLLLTTDSVGTNVDGTGQGEDVQSSGIVIGKDGADVTMVGKKISAVATGSVNIKGQDIILSAVNRITGAAKNILMEAGGQAALYLDRFSGTLAGTAVRMLAAKSVDFFRGSEIMSGMNWVDVDAAAPYDTMQQSMSSAHGSYYESEGWLPVTESDIADIKFTYRTPEQYGTDNPSEVEGATEFLVYRPSWASDQSMIPTIDWTEEEIEGTFPWPGAGVRDTALVTYEEGDNVDNGDPTNRENMTASGQEFIRTTMDEYRVTT